MSVTVAPVAELSAKMVGSFGARIPFAGCCFQAACGEQNPQVESTVR